MPLRDHFHTSSTLLNWEGLHAQWPSIMVVRLNQVLPPEFVARPRLHTGAEMELDVGALERESSDATTVNPSGIAVASWAPAAPSVLLDTDLPEPAEYEVHIYTQDEFRLVAAVELVSPSNKDRSTSRRSFVNKCESLLKKDVCVTIVDLVTNCTANLYGDLLDELDAPRTAVSNSLLYAVTCRGLRSGSRWRLESWEHELTLGAALPTLPLWLTPDLMVPLELDATYEEACRSLRIR